jgi:hypothetical protein
VTKNGLSYKFAVNHCQYYVDVMACSGPLDDAHESVPSIAAHSRYESAVRP